MAGPAQVCKGGEGGLCDTGLSTAKGTTKFAVCCAPSTTKFVFLCVSKFVFLGSTEMPSSL